MNATKVLTKHYENKRLFRYAEVQPVLINLPFNPADKTNWSAQGARKDMPHCRRFLIEKCRNQRPGQAGYIKGSKDG